MKALIFAAGLGTRLRPYTNDRPKALVEVAGRPMLEHVVERLKAAGVDDITINIHHFGQQVIDEVERKGGYGVNVHISDERDLLLDTGGGILHAREWLDGDEPFLVHNADILTDLDLRAFYDYHVHHQALSTILVKARETQRYFLLDDNDQLHGWINKATGEVRPDGVTPHPDWHELAFGGLHVVSPAIFDLLERYSATAGPKFSITPFYIAACATHKIHGYHPSTPYHWLDIGKPETLALANQLFQD